MPSDDSQAEVKPIDYRFFNIVSARRILQHPTGQSTLALYGVQLARYVLPLVTVPYLTRTLGPSGWGLVALTQAFGAYLGLPVDYGFNFSGTRQVARFRKDKLKLSEIFASVTGAKALLSSACVLLVLLASAWVPVFQGRQLLLWMGVLAALVPRFTPIWYLQGLERLRIVAALDICARIISTAGVFVFIHLENDAWKVLALQGLGSSLAMVAGFFITYRDLPFCLPSWKQIWDTLREGRSMFFSRSAISLYTEGNAFILGFFAPPHVVGYYAGAEKLVRASLQLLQPPFQTLFPKISDLVGRAPAKAVALVRVCTAIFGGAGLAGGLVISFAAPWLVGTILGHGYGPAVPILRVLSTLLPLIALNWVIGGLWMVPKGLDAAFESISLGAAFLNIGLAVLLAPRYSGLGMAFAVVLAESLVALSMYLYLRAKRFSPWHSLL